MQTELHNINEHLTEINDELLNYKDSGISDSIYKRIYEIAETMPIIKHPIINYGYAVKNNYFAILILVATCEDSINDNQLLFLQRMVMADSQRSTIDLYMAGIGNICPENVIFKIQENIKNELANQLLLDMLIIANLSMVKTRRTYEIIANISSFLGIQTGYLTHVSTVASSILRQNIDAIQEEKVNSLALEDDALYGYYLNEIPGWRELIIKQREQKEKEFLFGRLFSAIKTKDSIKKSEFKPRGVELSTKEEYDFDSTH